MQNANGKPDTTDWNTVDSALQPPFNTWPKWALELDIEIADIAGDIGANELEDTREGKVQLEAYDAVREIIQRMVSNGH